MNYHINILNNNITMIKQDSTDLEVHLYPNNNDTNNNDTNNSVNNYSMLYCCLLICNCGVILFLVIFLLYYYSK